MTDTTPLHYATCGTIDGLLFYVGEVQIFAPCADDALYVVPRNAPVVITARVPHLMETHLRATVIAPRLARLGGVA